jgi:8-oxo-dGTP pyrophosphatase MutT (NUDIX family)
MRGRTPDDSAGHGVPGDAAPPDEAAAPERAGGSEATGGGSGGGERRAHPGGAGDAGGSNPALERVCIVDERNRVVGQVARQVMRRRRLLHRATYVLVFNSQGQLHVQERTPTKDVYPGRLDAATGGVVLAGESYEEGAERELAEELGIRGVPLTAHGDFYFEDEWSRVWGRIFSCRHDGPVVLQAAEVAGVRMMTPAEVLASPPERFTPDGLDALRRLLSEGRGTPREGRASQG